MHRSLALALAALTLLVGACKPSSSEDQIGRNAHALAGQLMSPFCPGRTFADCPSPNAGAVRDEIRERLRGGEKPDAIRLELQSRYGDEVRAFPRSPFALALPALVLALGALALFLAYRRVLRAPASVEVLADDVARELASELASSNDPNA